MPGRAFIFGLGFTGRRFGEALQAKGFHVSGTTRSGKAIGDIETFAYGPDAATLSHLAALDTATHVLLSVPPGADGDPVLAEFGARLAANRNLEWVGYLGTTGVYGDRDGGAVTEDEQQQDGAGSLDGSPMAAPPAAPTLIPQSWNQQV